MIDLEFLSPDRAETEGAWSPRRRSPLERALAARGTELGIEDVSLTYGILEVRGDVNGIPTRGAEVVPVTDRKALVVCPFERVDRVRKAIARGDAFVIDQTGALAGLRIERPDAETLMRRLTDLDLDDLPAVGAVAHVQGHVVRDGPTGFRIFFPQEYGDYIGEVVVDAAEGLEDAPLRGAFPTTPPPDPLDRG